jgi:hypothetical protein
MDQQEEEKNPKFVWGEWGAPRLFFFNADCEKIRKGKV